MEEIAFTKYAKRGAYHWREYVKGTKYKTHVDFVCDWVKERSILDVGAGDGIITYLLNAKGIDNEDSAIKIAKTIGVDVQWGSAYDLEFEDDEFEAVTMIDVLEHFRKPEMALSEARRVAPVLYVATPERQPDKPIRDRFHVQEWTRHELAKFMHDNKYHLDGEMHFAKAGGTMYARFKRM